jgi:hypothetical protein
MNGKALGTAAKGVTTLAMVGAIVASAKSIAEIAVKLA